MWTVYLVKIDNKSYVGITSKGLDWRKRRHQVEARRGLTKTVFHNKLAKHIASAEWLILFEFDNKEQAIEAEKASIAQYDTLYPNGYNLTAGGEGIWGHKHSKEAIDKIRKANLGSKRTKKSKELMSKNRKGISTGTQSQERRDRKARDMGTKPFDVFTRDGTHIGRWFNKSKCARDLKIGRGTVIDGLLRSSPHYYNVKYVFKVVVDAEI